MMTTMAALFGGVPLMPGGGERIGNRQPLGYAMPGGLIVSQAQTRFTAPVAISISTRLANGFARGAVGPILTMRIRTRAVRSGRRPNDLTLRGNRHIRR
jgi:hypothetical protein